jgi:hypothetical protein
MARKTNRELISDCYASGGSPVVGLGGNFIACSLPTKSNKPVSYSAIGDMNQGVYNDQEGFYGATGGVDGYYNAAGDKFGQFLDKLIPSRTQKASTMQSESELNSAIAQALRESGSTTSQRTTQTGLPTAAKIGIGVVVVGLLGFVIYKVVKR